MSIENATPSVRRRRSAKDARAEALTAARRILLEQGPTALTLKAVATELGMTHANLLHHFGTAGALQTELMAMMLSDLSAVMRGVVARLRAGEATMDQLVALTFDAFGKGGAGHLAAWMVLNRETDQLEPIGSVVRELAAALEIPDHPAEVERAILFVTMMAFADGVIGKYFRPMLDQPVDAAREMTALLTPYTLKAPDCEP